MQPIISPAAGGLPELQVLLYIQQHLDENLTLDELAAVAHFSPCHFHRIFRGMVGESLAGHIRRLKLERAAGRLMHTRHSVTDLAFEAGYENAESFSRAFKDRFGLPPSAFRAERSVNGGDIQKFTIPNAREFVKGDSAMIDVKIKQLEPRKVVFVRHIGPYSECAEAWETLCKWAGRKGLFFFKKPVFIGLSYDDPDVTDPAKIRYDACLLVKKQMKTGGEIGYQEIPGGDFAVTLHKGPYERLSETYAALSGKWLPTSGRELKNAPSAEVYINDPKKTPPEELLTEIQLPLE